jgi:hypothetical protein
MKRSQVWTGAAALWGVACAAAAGEFRWEQRQGVSLALMNGEAVVWRCVFDPAESMTYLHPVALPDGTVLTEDQPADHAWHRALWFSWKYINGVNYWEYDQATGQPAGRTTWANVRVRARRNFSARVTMDLAYRDPAGATVLTERRTLEMSAPDAEGGYAIDWTGVFTAGEGEVTLDRTPLAGQPGGFVWGGYAGLSIRLANAMQEREAVTPDVAAAFDEHQNHRGRHTALAYQGLFGGRPAGVAVMDHPKNPDAPTPWYVIRSSPMTYFSPALLHDAPRTMAPGETMTLRYRILIRPGRWTPEALRAAADAWR